MSEIKSPLKPKEGKTLLLDRFSSRQIIEAYKEQGLKVERFFSKEYIELYKCVSTGYRFYYPPSIIGDSEFYEDLSISRKNYYSERWEHKKSLNFIEEGDKVLEIGSGFGIFLQMLKERQINAKGIELNMHAVNHCKNINLNVEGILIEDIDDDYKEHYDVVCSFQVLEHIYDVHNFIKNQLKILKKGGKLIVGVPNNNPYLFINDKYHTLNLPPHHAGLWNKNSLFSLERVFNLKVDKLIFEPMSLTYDYFIEFNLNKIKHKKVQDISKKLERKYRPIFRKLLSKFIKGRNILVVYKKL